MNLIKSLIELYDEIVYIIDFGSYLDETEDTIYDIEDT